MWLSLVDYFDFWCFRAMTQQSILHLFLNWEVFTINTYMLQQCSCTKAYFMDCTKARNSKAHNSVAVKQTKVQQKYKCQLLVLLTSTLTSVQLISIKDVSDVVIVVSRCTLSNIVASSAFILMWDTNSFIWALLSTPPRTCTSIISVNYTDTWKASLSYRRRVRSQFINWLLLIITHLSSLY